MCQFFSYSFNHSYTGNPYMGISAVKTQMKCSIMLPFIRACTVCYDTKTQSSGTEVHNYLKISTCGPLKYIMNNPIFIICTGNSIRIQRVKVNCSLYQLNIYWVVRGSLLLNLQATSSLAPMLKIEPNSFLAIHLYTPASARCTWSSLKMDDKVKLEIWTPSFSQEYSAGGWLAALQMNSFVCPSCSGVPSVGFVVKI